MPTAKIRNILISHLVDRMFWFNVLSMRNAA